MENSKEFIEQGITREVRFAVVMYGGVSLAIYINGIAQELLKMCRATVSKIKTEDLQTTEKIYRQISALMANEKLVENINAMLKNAAEQSETQEGKRTRTEIERKIEKTLDDLISLDDRPLTKFTVDVLTGTSAGGINAIFLAKALANNQDITNLKKLWLDEGDIKVLINDKKSLDKTGLSIDDKAKSLLNSQRMYLKLLEAFDAMGADSGEDSIYNDEIDLFVPATDFHGVVVPLRLLDEVVEEKRYGQVFRFRYESGKADGNDFNDNNQMLAFAARATSSFPFAFEPMRLSQAYSVIEQGFEDSTARIKNLKTQSKKYFPKIANIANEQDENKKDLDWTERDLVDGGVLDNKPFGYAIDVLTERRADFLCERKLIYIEPSPDNFNKTDKTNKKSAPNVIQNALASLSSIPSYETIREDLERLLERNNLIERVSEIIKKSEKDVFEYLMQFPNKEYYTPTSGDYWESQGLEDIVKWKGRAVLPYYRLRIADLTDEIARLVSVINGIEENTENFQTLRNFIKTWRDANFGFYKKSAPDEPEFTVLAFLRWYDFKYRLRRLRFVQEKALLLYRFDNIFKQDLKKRKNDFRKIKVAETPVSATVVKEFKKESNLADETAVKSEHPFVEPNLTVSRTFVEKLEKQNGNAAKSAKSANDSETVEIKPSEIIWLYSEQFDNEKEIGIEKIRLTANYFITHLKKHFREIQKRRERLFAKQGEFAVKDTGMEITPENLEKVCKYFAAKSGEFTADEAVSKKFIENNKEKFGDVFEKIEQTAAKLRSELEDGLKEPREKLKELFDLKSNTVPPELAAQKVEPELYLAVKGFLKHYYDNFDEYDQLSFPVFYETKVGEAVKVDVMRISPQDATGIIDERKEKRLKLAGESLFHFGAFLDRVWRFNDIMWGRLDGVERLITALLPDQKFKYLREFLTKKAHLEILGEELLTSKKSEIQTQLIKSLIEKSAGTGVSSGVNLTTGEFMDEQIQTKIERILTNCIDPESAYQFIKENHSVENRLEPKELLRVISRSTKVTGDIFEGIADKDSLAGNKIRWISRLGTIFWGLVEVAAPNSFWSLLFTHWLTLIYFFEVVLLVGSTIFVKPEIQQFATVTLILTLIIHLSAVTLGDYMRGGRFWSLIKFVAGGVFAILTIAGGVFIFSFFYDAELWKTFTDLQTNYVSQKTYVKLFPVALLITIFAAMLTWRETANIRIRFFGGLTVLFVTATVVLGISFNYLTRDAVGLDNLGAILSLEFVKTKDEIAAVAKDFGDPVRIGLRWALALDSFVFVPFYTGFLLIFSRLFNLRNWKSKNALTIASAILIVGTGLADLSENFFTYSVLDTALNDLAVWKIYGIWISASAKWFLLALATAVLSLIFWRRNWWMFFTVGFLTASILGVIGVFYHKFIPQFMFLQLILLLAVGMLFLIFPDKFKREFN